MGLIVFWWQTEIGADPQQYLLCRATMVVGVDIRIENDASGMVPRNTFLSLAKDY